MAERLTPVERRRIALTVGVSHPGAVTTNLEALFRDLLDARLAAIGIDLDARIAGCREMGGDYATAFADGLESARSHLSYSPGVQP